MDVLWSSCSSWMLGVVVVITLAWLTSVFLRQRKTYDLRGRYVMITGCDSGFGRAIALRLDQLGCCVLATCLTRKGAEELKNTSSERMDVFLMDVTNSAQIQQTYAAVQRKLTNAQAGLWGLVNNAGIFYWGPIEWYPLDAFKRLADVNLWGMIDVTKTFLPLLKAVKGRVVNFSSIAGRICYPNGGPYSITKYGVEAFSDTLRREMAPWGVRVSIVEPGGFRTALTSPQVLTRHAEEAWSNLSEEMKAEYDQEFVKERLSAIVKWHNDDTSNNDDHPLVVDPVISALAAERPRARYVIGSDALLMSLISHLPTNLEDWVMDKVLVGSPMVASKGPERPVKEPK